MSRIGKKPIAIPAGVTVTVNGSVITVKGAKGELTRDIGTEIGCTVENNTIHMVCPENADSDVQAKHGLYRALVANMVKGVHDGFARSLIINGVGYKAAVQGDKLILNIGYSNPVEVIAPKGITFETPSATEIVVKGFDKELVGQTAANIKAKRPVEPYHAYGVRYKEEVVIMKEGKKAGK
ncbi:MAG TPA: 50S ribosomal protein L6 [Clostridiales bacterium]|jgi:ribosomal protein L6|uniref:50S ribosomal protein L6 n=1 Tax=Candidatus Fimenecus sp. TaxID=3022888 RepID=UPI000EE937CD|nr:50S ribosomal protein L6 [Clostridiales bacterium]